MDITKHHFQSAEFRSVVEAALRFFEGTPVHRLPPPEKFSGPGVYAVYFVGDGALYASLAASNIPLYVGKAVPSGWRIGRGGSLDDPVLFARLNQHARSVAATHLDEADFRCRFMILTGVEIDLIVPVEAALIRRYNPLWNTVVTGFGNHDPGVGRSGQAVSEWDVLHPGREWAARLTRDAPSRADIVAKVRAHLSGD